MTQDVFTEQAELRKLQLEFLQTAFVWKGYLDEVPDSGERKATVENVQQILCARSRCLAVANNGEHEDFRAWSEEQDALIDKRVQMLGDKTANIVDAVTARMKDQLRSAADDIRPLAYGLENGGSWKAQLEEDAPLAAVVQAGEALTKGAPAKKLAGYFLKLKQDRSC